MNIKEKAKYLVEEATNLLENKSNPKLVAIWEIATYSLFSKIKKQKPKLLNEFAIHLMSSILNQLDMVEKETEKKPGAGTPG